MADGQQTALYLHRHPQSTINMWSSLLRPAGRICELRHSRPPSSCLRSPQVTQAGIRKKEEKHSNRYEPGTHSLKMTKEEKVWFRLCLFFLVCRVHSSELQLCVLSWRPGRKTDQKKGKKKRLVLETSGFLYVHGTLGESVCVHPINPILLPEIYGSGKYVLKITIPV